MKPILFVSALLFFFILSGTTSSQVTKKFKAKNETGLTVTSLRISSNDEYNWSLPLNMNEKTLNNQWFEFAWKIDTARCTYDFKFAVEGGEEYILEDVKLCEKNEVVMAIPVKKEEK